MQEEDPFEQHLNFEEELLGAKLTTPTMEAALLSSGNLILKRGDKVFGVERSDVEALFRFLDREAGIAPLPAPDEDFFRNFTPTPVDEQGADQGRLKEPAQRPTPAFIAAIMTDYTHDLGDNAEATRSNITHATKIYYMMLDHNESIGSDPQGFFAHLLAEAKLTVQGMTNIKQRNGNRSNRIPAFFMVLEKRLNLDAGGGTSSTEAEE